MRQSYEKPKEMPLTLRGRYGQEMQIFLAMKIRAGSGNIWKRIGAMQGLGLPEKIG